MQTSDQFLQFFEQVEKQDKNQVTGAPVAAAPTEN